MTAPLRRSGELASFIERSCRSKLRYCDDMTARAAGQLYMEHAEKAGKPRRQLYVYKCPLCRGWHLSKRFNPDRCQQVDYMYEATQQPRDRRSKDKQKEDITP